MQQRSTNNNQPLRVIAQTTINHWGIFTRASYVGIGIWSTYMGILRGNSFCEVGYMRERKWGFIKNDLNQTMARDDTTI